jgi:hypothetical protein
LRVKLITLPLASRLKSISAATALGNEGILIDRRDFERPLVLDEELGIVR